MSTKNIDHTTWSDDSIMASVRLGEILAERNDRRMYRKVSAVLQEYREVMSFLRKTSALIPLSNFNIVVYFELSAYMRLKESIQSWVHIVPQEDNTVELAQTYTLNILATLHRRFVKEQKELRRSMRRASKH